MLLIQTKPLLSIFRNGLFKLGWKEGNYMYCHELHIAEQWHPTLIGLPFPPPREMQNSIKWLTSLQLRQMFTHEGRYVGRAMVGDVGDDCTLDALVRKGI